MTAPKDKRRFKPPCTGNDRLSSVRATVQTHSHVCLSVLSLLLFTRPRPRAVQSFVWDDEVFVSTGVCSDLYHGNLRTE